MKKLSRFKHIKTFLRNRRGMVTYEPYLTYPSSTSRLLNRWVYYKHNNIFSLLYFNSDWIRFFVSGLNFRLDLKIHIGRY